MNRNRRFAQHMAYDAADAQAINRSNLAAGLVGLTSPQGVRLDSAEDASIFFARELDYVKAHSYDRLYPELTALSIFPQTSEVPEGAESVTWYSYERTGMAQIIANYATDLPRADIKGEPNTSYVKSLGDSYGYSIQEMRASMYAGKSLDARKADSARYNIERLRNKLAWAGDVKANIKGVLSAGTGIPKLVLPASVGNPASTAWKDKTADEILNDIKLMYQYQTQLTQGVERADTLVLPNDVYIDISQRRVGDTSDTVLSYILKNAPYRTPQNQTPLTIVAAPELMAGSGETNPAGVNTAVLFKNDPEKFSIESPMPYTQHPVQTMGLEMTVPCEARFAGAIIYYPFSLLIVENI